jgi:hypothetical protein
MLEPPSWLVARYGIPKEVLREAFGKESAHRQKVQEIVRPIVEVVSG